jgi:hypothetical protein
MDIDKMLFETKGGQRRLKPNLVIALTGGLFALFALTVIMVARQNKPKQVDSPFAQRHAVSRQKLDYNIIKLDTVQLGDYLNPQAGTLDEPVRAERVERGLPKTEPATSVRRSAPNAAVPPAAPRFENGSAGSIVDRNPNMIVHTSMGAGTTNPAAVSGGTLGIQSALVKVTLVDKAAVSNNSLIEARVLNEATLGTTLIPRRARLTGTASLQGSRVFVEFREIRIDGVARSCSGRAYDMKKQLGLPYAAVQAAQASASKAVVDELKSAASSIPVVGRYANQTNTNSLTEDVARFNEGYEFYVQLNSIY